MQNSDWRLVLIGCCMTVTVVCFHFPSRSEDDTRPAIAEDAYSPDESLNPLADLVREKRKTEAQLRKALQKPVTIAFEKVSLREAMKRLADAAEVNIVFNQGEITAADISIDNSILSYSGRDKSIDQTLKGILRPMGLGYVIRDEAIRVTSPDEYQDPKVSRDYDVGDLLAWEEAHRHEPRALSSTVFQTERPFDWLREMIEHETSGPWIVVDGTGGMMEFRGNVVTIQQYESVHKEIPDVLLMLRRFIEGKFGKHKSVFLESNLSPRRAMARRVTLTFKQTPLKEVAERLTKMLNVPVVLDKYALSEEGVSEDTPITFEVRNVTLHSALKWMLEPLGLDAVVYAGAINISTTIAADERHHTVGYDVRDLIQEGGVRHEFFLNHLWMETSGPWFDVDGTGGDVQEPLPGLLIIHQTERNQEAIVAYFDDLRQSIQDRKAQGLPLLAAPETPKPDDVVTEIYKLHPQANPEEVQKAVYDLVESKSWEPHGGQGQIRIINGLLVVKNRVKVHWEVNRFLLRVTSALEKQSQRNPLGGGFFSPIEPPAIDR